MRLSDVQSQTLIKSPYRVSLTRPDIPAKPLTGDGAIPGSIWVIYTGGPYVSNHRGSGAVIAIPTSCTTISVIEYAVSTAAKPSEGRLRAKPYIVLLNEYSVQAKLLNDIVEPIILCNSSSLSSV